MISIRKEDFSAYSHIYSSFSLPCRETAEIIGGKNVIHTHLLDQILHRMSDITDPSLWTVHDPADEKTLFLMRSAFVSRFLENRLVTDTTEVIRRFQEIQRMAKDSDGNCLFVANGIVVKMFELFRITHGFRESPGKILEMAKLDRAFGGPLERYQWGDGTYTKLI
jgi:hypothetical protein